MVRRKLVLGRYAALRCLWHEVHDDESTITVLVLGTSYYRVVHDVATWYPRCGISFGRKPGL
eukprot:5340501-Prymnesium_polylepis.1